jgi:hypothetical protein
MTTQQVTYWMQRLQEGSDDLALARQVLDKLVGYRMLPQSEDLATMLALFNAIRIDQMAKEATDNA